MPFKVLFVYATFILGACPAQASDTAIFGGPGGVPFQTPCRPGDYLVGLAVDSGDWIDAIAPVCARYDGDALVADEIGKFAGMMGGTRMPDYRCKFGTGIITSVVVQATFDDNSQAKYADNLDVSCANVNTSTVPAYDFLVLTNDRAIGGGKCDVGWQCLNDVSVPYPIRPLSCSPGEVATGIQGRAGNYVDALGLICGPPPAKTFAQVPLPPAPAGAHANTDRPGDDYKSYATNDPADCQAKCQGDATCKAWAWALPGTNGAAPATCYLKRRAPAESANNCCIAGVPTALPAAPPGANAGTDLPGSDYFSFTSNDPPNCALSCAKDAQCKAWTWAVPGTNGQPDGKCYMKNAVPTAKANNCCISAVEVSAAGTAPAAGIPPATGGSSPGAPVPPGALSDTDRPGGDIGAATSPDPASCEAACTGAAKCKAWTWAEPGTNKQPEAICYLKNVVPALRPDTCCVSGVMAGVGGPPNFAGAWKTTINGAPGTMTLFKSGGVWSGTYTALGLAGVISKGHIGGDGHLRFSWSHPGGIGKGNFVLTGPGSFTGTFYLDGNPGGVFTWNGHS